VLTARSLSVNSGTPHPTVVRWSRHRHDGRCVWFSRLQPQFDVDEAASRRKHIVTVSQSRARYHLLRYAVGTPTVTPRGRCPQLLLRDLAAFWHRGAHAHRALGDSGTQRPRNMPCVTRLQLHGTRPTDLWLMLGDSLQQRHRCRLSGSRFNAVSSDTAQFSPPGPRWATTTRPSTAFWTRILDFSDVSR